MKRKKEEAISVSACATTTLCYSNYFFRQSELFRQQRPDNINKKWGQINSLQRGRLRYNYLCHHRLCRARGFGAFTGGHNFGILTECASVWKTFSEDTSCFVDPISPLCSSTSACPPGTLREKFAEFFCDNKEHVWPRFFSVYNNRSSL